MLVQTSSNQEDEDQLQPVGGRLTGKTSFQDAGVPPGRSEPQVSSICEQRECRCCTHTHTLSLTISESTQRFGVCDQAGKGDFQQRQTAVRVLISSTLATCSDLALLMLTKITALRFQTETPTEQRNHTHIHQGLYRERESVCVWSNPAAGWTCFVVLSCACMRAAHALILACPPSCASMMNEG